MIISCQKVPGRERTGLVVLAILSCAMSLSCASLDSRAFADEMERVRAVETDRLRALVDADMATARRIHATDFQVIGLSGLTASRDQFLQYVASGTFDYLAWEPGPIAVRQQGRMAAVRYRSRVTTVVRGQRLPPIHAWSTGLYEKRGGRWQIVWFQLTQIATPDG